MKKLTGLVVAGVTAFVLSGCGSSSSNDYYDSGPIPDPDLTTLFLYDSFGASVGGVPYVCDSSGAGITLGNGEFTFYQGEECTFDFLGIGLGGYSYIDPLFDDPIFITDDLGHGKIDIPYYCDVAQSDDWTDSFGAFEYAPDDICTFYFSY